MLEKTSIQFVFLVLIFNLVAAFDLNPCSTSECQNFAKCVPLNTINYTCVCTNSSLWTGVYCQIPTSLNPCSSSPCKQNSSCLFDVNFNVYTCICQPGYTGIACDQIINQCLSYPCKNRGTCTNIDSNGVARANYYNCQCAIGYYGKNCDQIINYCASNPCLNGGVCNPAPNSYTCTCVGLYSGERCEIDLTNSNATCTCFPGFYGPTCSLKVNQCLNGTNPCNNGSCIPVPSGSLSYTCSCFPGFTGINCEQSLSLCSYQPPTCLYGGVCSQTSLSTYSCACPAGTLGNNCQFRIPICASTPCKNNGTCLEPSLNSYICLCPSNYIGSNCEILVKTCLVNVCRNGGICSFGPNGYNCFCQNGFTGSSCEISLDPCASNPCLNNGTCLRGLNETYVCICPVPYQGQVCESNYNLCSIYNPCQNNGNCSTVGSSYYCSCPSWYSGVYCQNYTSICASNPCGPNGQCFELGIGSYQCFCNRYYTGKNCSTFLSACNSNPCNNGGNCSLDASKNFVCTCSPGWTSRRCEVEINGCDSNPCVNGGICNTYFNYYNCTCNPGYSGANCQISNDPCLNNPCSNNATCSSQYGRAICICPPNFSGNLCQFKIDFCLSRPCQNAGNCLSNSTGYGCTCLAGFTGVNCQQVQDPCSNFCQNGGKCYTNAELIVGCECPCQFQGRQCQTTTNFCANNLCQNGICVPNPNSCGYTCACNAGYLGKNCEVPINACFSLTNNSISNCLNGATCIDLHYTYTCQCTPGFTGNNCQIPRNTCNPNNCKNGATCIPLSNDYVCTCPCPFYTGKNCDFYTDICSIEGSQCLNGGTCISNGCSFSCGCPQNYTGFKCEQIADPCSYNTCSNNGTCVSNLLTNTFKCACSSSFTGPLCNSPVVINPTNPCNSSPCNIYQTCNSVGNTNYSCTCPPLYTGQACEIRIRACASNPCQFNSICMDNLAWGNYTCLCNIGLTGLNCQTQVNACNSNPCYNNGVCNTTGINHFKCTCPPGVTGTLCEIIVDPCQSYPCFNGGACNNVNGSWSCNCSSSCYSGPNCNELVSTCSSHNCSGNGVCINTGPCLYKCICSPGTTGVDCQTVIPPCDSNPCSNNGTCVSNNNSYSCVCPPGYTGLRCNVRLVSCSSSPCENGGVCSENTNVFGYNCTCAAGWTGTSCEIDFNECSSLPCQNNGICTEDKINSFKCFCSAGYTGSLCSQLIDPCLSNPCTNGATCNSTNNIVSCICPTGFYGSRCQFTINNCASGPCLNGGICINRLNSYQCNCPPQFSGLTCNRTSCLNYCLNSGTCLADPLGNALSCVCQPGFTGSKCESIDNPCLSNPCTTGQGVCVNQYYGVYSCACNFGYYGQFCESKVQVCNPSPCLRGTCISSTPGIALCQCPPGFTGRFCESSTNVCSSANPCLNGGVCTNPYLPFTCPPGLTGANCGVVIQTCSHNPCSQNSTCIQQSLNSFTCLCPPYLTGQYCEQTINLCAINNPCPASIQCVQISYLQTKCICPAGFTGPTCSQRFDVCQSNPCLNGECVSPLPGLFRCTCQPGYMGNYCEITQFVCDYTTCLNGGYCVNNYTMACICPSTYTGMYCETPINPCDTPPSPIQLDICNGNGDCYYVAPGHYYCNCNNCNTGTNCEIAPDPCFNNLCAFNNSCVALANSCDYQCNCPVGYTGVYCETPVDPCSSVTCFNNGTCVNNATLNGFNCTCPHSFTGQFCETQLNQCTNYNCSGNGVCIVNQQYNQPMCVCQYGFTGVNCQTTVNFCSNNPCLNNATCTSLSTTYSCNCANGFGGQRCEEILNLCELEQPCEYGNCFRGQPGDYVCFCFAGYTGKNCSIPVKYCNSNPCLNGNCTNYIGGYSCSCNNGYQGINCDQLVNPCTLNKNLCGNGQCILNTSSPNNYYCSCNPGYNGTTCNNQINLCNNNGNCLNNSTCVQLTPSFAYCNCTPDFSGSQCQTPVNPCNSTVTCFNNGVCNNLGKGNFNCTCPTGFKGTYCEIQPNFCLPNPCLNNGTCLVQSGGYLCQCPINYGGVNCQISQICSNLNNPCKNSAQCLKTLDGTFTCICNPGFIGTYCDQIYNPCISYPCLNGGSCSTYNLTNYLCTCPTGLTGPTCSNDINECLVSNTCKNGATCINTFGSYLCKCPTGFTGSDCSQLSDPCSINQCNSTGSTSCVASGSNYTCVCKPNYNGIFCNQFFSPCLSNPCLNGGSCNFNANSNSYTCQCAAGFTGSQCQTSINFCFSNSSVCGPYGTCYSSSLSAYNCTCYPGFTGSNCQTQINTCTSAPCLNGGVCTASINYFTCQCPLGFTGQTCQVVVNPCSNFNCNNGTCNTVNNQAYCTCKPGYAGSNCQFFIGCSILCLNGGVCNSAYTACVCPANFTGSDCSVSTNPCSSTPCLNNGTCTNLNLSTNSVPSFSYSCSCPTGFTGNNCQTKVAVCNPNPCLNGGACSVNSSTNPISYACTCPQPYTGQNCTTSLSICNFVNCGQGSCVAGAVYPNYNCSCNPGYSGAQCNIRNQGCLSSPCQNGGICNSLNSSSYNCTCTPEYQGTNCEIAKTCVPTFNYCSSMPCQNNGKCIQIGSTCTIYCNCNTSISYGTFCQFLISPSVYTYQSSLNLLASSSASQNINFNLQILPCLTTAWQQSNQQFACPNGFVMIPSVSNLCFFSNSLSSFGLTKQIAQSNCQLLGGSLVSFETTQKLSAVIQWLTNVQNTQSQYYWLNTALQTSLTGQKFWVWASNGQPINFDWAPSQITNFNGDSIYLNTTDNQFYVGSGSQNYSSKSGLLCQAPVSGLSSSNLNVVLLNQTQAFRPSLQGIVQLNYSVSIVLSNQMNLNQVQPPSFDALSQTLTACSQTLVATNASNPIYTVDQAYSISICGNSVTTNALDQISSALLSAWLQARPEFVQCSVNNCVQIFILSSNIVNLDQWNQVTRIFYVITVNGVLLDPSQQTVYPTAIQLQTFIGAVPMNFNYNYQLCAAKLSSSVSVNFLNSPAIQNTPVPLVLDRFILQTTNPVYNNFISAIQNSLILINPVFSQYSINIIISSKMSSQFGIYSNNVGVNSAVSLNQVLYPLTSTSFQIILNGTVLSFATQSLFDLNKFYTVLNNLITLDSSLNVLGLHLISPNLYPILEINNVFHLTLTRRIAFNNATYLQNAIKTFINQNAIQFNWCKLCWNNTSSINVQMIHMDLLVDITGTRYFDYLFVIILQNPSTGATLIPKLSNEVDFISKYNAFSSNFINTLNSNNFQVSTNTNLRRFTYAVTLQLQQSVVYEDISNLINIVASGIQATTNGVLASNNFIVYWGQNEYLSIDSLGQSNTYWQAIFFVVSPTDVLFSTMSNVYSPTYDFSLNLTTVNQLLNLVQGARGDFYFSSQIYNPLTDFPTKDLFYIPCYGAVNNQNYQPILNKYFQLWSNYLSSISYPSTNNVTLQSFYFISVPTKVAVYFDYISRKGYFAVFPFSVKTNIETIYPDVYSGPSFDTLKNALNGYCNVSDPISAIFRSDQLNYITASGISNFDQADSYLLNINLAYQAYLAQLNPAAVLTAPAQIQGLLTYYTAQVQSVTTRIYYQLFGNTTVPLDAYNFQIQYTSYKVVAPSNLSPLLRTTSRGLFQAISGRSININTLALIKMPQIALENVITFDQSNNLIDSLTSFWKLMLTANNISYNVIEIQIGTSEECININTLQLVTNIYYVVSVDKKIYYATDLPNIDANALAILNGKLYPNGIQLAQAPYVKIRTLFLDIDTEAASFNIQLTAMAIKNSWMFYMNTSNLIKQSFSLADVQVSMIDQNVYVGLNKPYIGIKYAISIKNMDPSFYALPNPTKAYFSPYFSPLVVYGGVPLLLRRIYVYENLISNQNLFNDTVYMQLTISNIWKSKNPVTDPTADNPIYLTPYYSTTRGNLLSNIQNVQLYRSAYTQSISGNEPLDLLYQTPTENDFNQKFLDSAKTPFLMGFCFSQCYNYRQSGLYISGKYINDSASILKSIQTAWISSNQISSSLLNPIQVKISFNSNSVFAVNQLTGFSNVIFNVFVTNPNSKTQIDSLDLNEPSLATYLDAMQTFFPSMTTSELQTISPNAIAVGPSSTPSLPKTTQSIILSTTQGINKSNNGSQEGGLLWWGGLLIAFGVLLFICIMLVIGCCVVRVKNLKHRFFSTMSYSSTSSSVESSHSGLRTHKHRPLDQFSVLTSAFPQVDAFTSVTNMTPRSSFDIRLISNDLNSQQIFGQIPKPSNSKTPSIAQFYPGIPIESIVPNPVFVTPMQTNNNEAKIVNQDRLITSVYVTNSTSSQHANENINLNSEQI